MMLEDFGWCLAFLAYWERSVRDAGVDVATKADVIIAVNNVMLGLKAFREYFPKVLFEPGRINSRFVEYMFQFLRLGGTHNKISAMSGLTKLKLGGGGAACC